MGGMLLLDVDYDNMGPNRPGFPLSFMPETMAIKPITYTYRPYFVPTTSNSRFQLVEQSDHADYRVIDIWYGVTIKMQFNGRLVVFSWSKLLTALTSGLVLLSMASTIVLYTATFLLPFREKYNALIYQMSEDFTDFRALSRVKDFDAMENHFASGSILKEAHKSGGENSLSNNQILQLLNCYEIRLNRLDAMDLRMIYEMDDPNPPIMRQLWQKTQKGFYSKYGIGKPAE